MLRIGDVSNINIGDAFAGIIVELCAVERKPRTGSVKG